MNTLRSRRCLACLATLLVACSDPIEDAAEPLEPGPSTPDTQTGSDTRDGDGASDTAPGPGAGGSTADAGGSPVPSQGLDPPTDPSGGPELTDQGDGTASDATTGLMWAQCSEGQAGGDGCEGEPTEMTFEDATAACDALVLGGFDDWRLPDRHELFSLIDPSAGIPNIGPELPNNGSSHYWTASPVMPDGGTEGSYVWALALTNGPRLVWGRHGEMAPDADQHAVRCVRLGPLARPMLEVTIPEPVRVVLDHESGLMWQGCRMDPTDEDTCDGEPLEALRFADAASHCGELVLADFDDWRLPTAYEAERLVDETWTRPFIDRDAFPLTLNGTHEIWTATPISDALGNHVLVVSFQEGTVKSGYKEEEADTMCVRSHAP